MPNVAQQQRSSGTTKSAGIVGKSSISDRARRRRREASPEPREQLHCNRRWFDFDTSREGGNKLCRSSYLRRTKFPSSMNITFVLELGRSLCKTSPTWSILGFLPSYRRMSKCCLIRPLASVRHLPMFRSVVFLMEDAKVMLTRNLWVDQGLTNGSMGQCTKFSGMKSHNQVLICLHVC